MKRYIFGTALAALVMLSSCEAIQPQEDMLPEDGAISGNVMVDSPQLDTVVFTATIGADTKTHIHWSDESCTYKTIWNSNDYIYVTAGDGNWYGFYVTDGAGTSTATFEGTIVESDVYTAVYGVSGWGDHERAGVYLFSSQWMEYNQYDEHTFGGQVSPMAARSASRHFEFKNLCSVLKVCVTGNGETLNSIVFRPNDADMAVCGSADIAFTEDGEPYFSVIYKESDQITWTSGQYIGPYETNAYIVLPPGLYEGGFELEIMTDKGGMTVSTSDDLYLERSTVYNVNVAYETEFMKEQYWQIEVTYDGGQTWYDSQMQYEDGMFVMKDWYFEDNAEFRFQELLTGIRYGCSGYYRQGGGKTNTRVNLASGSDWWWFMIYDPGYYDIYIDPMEMCIYIMSDGYTPDDIPTKETVLYDRYSDIYNNVLTGDWVKLYGAVIAKCGYGFILAIDGYRSNSVYVYDRNGLCDVELGNWIDIYAKLAYYRSLPELVVNEGEYWMHVLDDTYNDYEPETPYIITDPSSFASSEYTYIKYIGTLNISGSYHNIIFEGNTQFKGSITAPLQDLTQFDGERVVVDGYYAGSNTSGDVTYINTIMKRIYPMEENGSSTEDIIPGESFPVTRPRAGFGGQTSVMGSPSPVMRELSYQFYPER